MHFGPGHVSFEMGPDWTTFEPNQTNISYRLFKCLGGNVTNKTRRFICTCSFGITEKPNKLQLLTPRYFQTQDATLHVLIVKSFFCSAQCMKLSNYSKNSRCSSLLSHSIDQLVLIFL